MTFFFQNLSDKALSLLYPYVCPVCGQLLSVRRRVLKGKEGFVGMQTADGSKVTAAPPNPYICPDCYRLISFPQEPRCLLCSRPVSDPRELYCRDCMKGKRHFDGAVFVMLHDEVSRKILYDLKYYNCADNAKMAAYEAAVREGDRVLAWHPDVIIPVPLYPKRERKRGFNQSFLLAQQFSRALEERSFSETDSKAADDYDSRRIPVDAGYLIRVRRTAPQKELTDHQRLQNVRNAFAIHYKQDLSRYLGKTILLVDDIYTSGATLSECARVLKCAGASYVYCLTFSAG